MLLNRKNNRIFLTELPELNKHIAKFTDVLSKASKSNFVLEHNYGVEMLNIYQYYRDDMHIANITKMLQEMESKFNAYNDLKRDVHFEPYNLK